jgi:hypothetical protein
VRDLGRIVLMAVCASTVSLGAAAQQTHMLWKPVADTVFLQEVGEQVDTSRPLTKVALVDGALFAVMDGSLYRLDGDSFNAVADAPGGIQVLESYGGALWFSDAEATYRSDGRAFARVAAFPMVDFCVHRGEVHGAKRDAIFRFDGESFVDIKPESGYQTNNTTMIMEDGSQVLTDPIEIAPVRGIASYSDTLYLLRDGGIALLDGAMLVPDPLDWGTYPSPNLRAMHSHGSRLLLATDRGVGVLRGMAMTALRGADGLPYEDTTCLASGFDGDVWIGTTTGAIRQTGDEYQYFGAYHWLPGDGVNDIAVGDRVVYIATNAGLGIIRYEPYTLAKKAAYFERNLGEWGHKRLGFVHQLYWSGGEDGEWLREISDNDGGHSTHYFAALCFKYAVTKDKAVRREAEYMFESMRWLQRITGTDGFFARSIWSVEGDKGELSRHGSGGLPAKWYPTADGKWYWKGDTSSDEVNAQFYGVSLFHDLVADARQKKLAAEHLANIAGHIVKNGWVLRDMDGVPTRWGRWDPDYLLRPYGFEARGLNGMEAQTYVTTALAMTGEPRFHDALDQLVRWGYPTYTVRQKLTFPPESVVTWDDLLAFRCYWPLLTYATDPELRSIYLRSMERSWEVMRMQHVPFFNFIYGGLSGNDCEADRAVQHLREWSLDTVGHSYRNSHRADLAPEPGYVPYARGTRAISPRELTADWESRSSVSEPDGHRAGRTVTPATGWLEDYWMGRYYGFIEAPTTTDPALVSIPDGPIVRRGATPYDGSPRPDLSIYD